MLIRCNARASTKEHVTRKQAFTSWILALNDDESRAYAEICGCKMLNTCYIRDMENNTETLIGIPAMKLKVGDKLRNGETVTVIRRNGGRLFISSTKGSIIIWDDAYVGIWVVN